MNNPLRTKPWLWIILAFVVQLTAWGIWFTLASKNKVAEVPLQTGPALGGKR